MDRRYPLRVLFIKDRNTIAWFKKKNLFTGSLIHSVRTNPGKFLSQTQNLKEKDSWRFDMHFFSKLHLVKKAPHLGRVSVLLIYPMATSAWETLRSKAGGTLFSMDRASLTQRAPLLHPQLPGPTPGHQLPPARVLHGSSPALVSCRHLPLAGPPWLHSVPPQVPCSALLVSGCVHLLPLWAAVLSGENKSKNHDLGYEDSS